MRNDRVRPYILTLMIVLLDQWLKYLIIRDIPLNTIAKSFAGGFLRIVHVRNNAIGFSIGNSLPHAARVILFIVVPLVVMVFLLVYVWRTDEFNTFQRWMIAGVVGGGIGNLVDRIFRGLLVVDYIDVKFYGIFGMERWPTFNLADSSIVVCGILLIVSYLFSQRMSHE